MNFLKPIFVLVMGALLFLSCDDKDLTPVFLDVKTEMLDNCIDVTNFNDQHETNYDMSELQTIASSRFRDIECWLDGVYLGIFELPCKIPMLPEYDENNELKILPCIRLDGNSAIIKTYSYLKTYTREFDDNVEFVTIDENSPIEFEYISAVQFPLIDNFESGTRFEMEDDSADVVLQTKAIDGNNVGYIALQEDQDFTIITSSMLTAPGANGNEVIWEMTYACDADIRTSVKAMASDGTIVHVPLGTIVNSNGEWRQIHTNLTNVVNYYNVSNISAFRLMIEGAANPDKETSNFYIDDIKVISYK